MTQANKEYYNKLLEKNKNNIKGTWNILNKVIRNTSGPTNAPSHFINEDNKIVKNMNEVANGFNSFFCKCWT